MIGWMLRMIAVAALIAAAAWSADRAMGSLARPRRHVWAAGLLLVVLLPAIALLAPGWLPDLGLAAAFASAAGLVESVTFFGEPEAAGVVYSVDLLATSTATNPGAAGTGWSEWVAMLMAPVWLLASIGVALALLAGRARLRRATARWRGTTIEGVAVRVSHDVGPAVVGLLRPKIVLPAWANDLPVAERALIVRHELEHVRAGDSRLLAAATVPLVLLPWCLPLWWMHRRLRDAVETDCDARVLARGADVRTYGSALLRTAGHRSTLPIPVPALSRSPSLLERRILAMTRKQPRHPILIAASLLAVAGAAVLAACGALDSTNPLEPEIEEDAAEASTYEAAKRLHEDASELEAEAELPDTRPAVYEVRLVRPDGGPVDVPEGTGLVFVEADRSAAEVEQDSPAATRNPADQAERSGRWYASSRETLGETREEQWIEVRPTTTTRPQRIEEPEAPLGRLEFRPAQPRQREQPARRNGAEPTPSAVGTTVVMDVPDGDRGTPIIRVRSSRDLPAGRRPIIFIDGRRAVDGDLQAVRPSTIDEIEIIKGPAAMRRYGATAEGGVILIQTKR